MPQDDDKRVPGAEELSGLAACILRTQPIDHDKRTQQIARLLTRAGMRVTVVSRVPEGYVVPDGFDFTVAPVVAAAPSKHPWRWLRVASNLWREFRVSVSLVYAARRVRADVVHAMNVDTLLTAFLAARGAAVIYDSREHFATTGTVKPRVRRWWLLKERFLVPRVGRVVTVTDMIARDLAKRHRIVAPAVLVNGATEVVSTVASVRVPLRLLHQGKLFFDRHLDDIIRAVALQEGGAILTIQGWGEAEDSLRRLTESLSAAKWVQFVAPCSPSQVVESASGHDVGIINIWPENDSHCWTGSNKLFDYMGAGLAQVVTNLDFTRGIVEAEGCGIVVDPPTVERFTSVFSHLIDHPEEVERMKRNAVVAAPKYTWDAQAPMLYRAYADALETKSR